MEGQVVAEDGSEVGPGWRTGRGSGVGSEDTWQTRLVTTFTPNTRIMSNLISALLCGTTYTNTSDDTPLYDTHTLHIPDTFKALPSYTQLLVRTLELFQHDMTGQDGYRGPCIYNELHVLPDHSS